MRQPNNLGLNDSGHSNPAPLELPSCELNGLTVNTENVQGRDLSCMNLRDIVFTGNSLKNANFSGSCLHNVTFDNCDLEAVNFSNTDLTEVTFKGLTLNHVNFTNAKMVDCTLEHIASNNIDMSSARLLSSKLMHVDFSTAIFENTSLRMLGVRDNSTVALPSGCFVSNPRTRYFNNVFYIPVDVIGAGLSLEGITLRNFDLSQIDCSKINFFGLSLSKLDLSNVDLSNAKLDGVLHSDNIRSNDQTTLPAGYSLVGGVLVHSLLNLEDCDLKTLNLAQIDFKGISFQSVSLSGLDLSYVDLSDADFNGILFSEGVICNQHTSVPKGYQIINGYLVGPNMNLSYADLRGGDLRDVNLVGSRLPEDTGESSKYTDFIDGTTILPSGFQYINGYIFATKEFDVIRHFYGDDFSDMNFAGVDFSLLRLSYVCIAGADLSRAQLFGAKLTSCSGEPAELSSEYTIVDGRILGPGLKFNAETFIGERFENVNMTSVDFSDADLRSAEFTAVDLSNAQMDNADLRDAVLRNLDLSTTSFNKADLSCADLHGSTITLDQLLKAHVDSSTILPEPFMYDVSLAKVVHKV